MKALFLGGDKRQLEIIKHLLEKKIYIDLYGYENIDIPNTNKKKNINISEYDLIFFPISGVKDDLSISSIYSNETIYLPVDLLKNTKAKIFTGVKTQKLNEMLMLADKNCVALMEDSEVKKENSIPTVEGIIADLIYNTDYTIYGANIFILGYGNVGKTLVKVLNALGANVTVGILNKQEFTELMKNKVSCIFTSDKNTMQELISKQAIIINTIPELILDREYLETLDHNTYVLDISSHPHGVDFKSANDLKIKNKLLLGIPGSVAPKTAGHILVKKIDAILKEDL